MKFLVLAHETDLEKHRLKRVIEEIKKRDHEVTVVCINESKIFADKLLFKGEEIDLTSYSAVYSLGNPEANQYIISLISHHSDAVSWPSPKHNTFCDKFYEGIFLNGIGIPTPQTVLLFGKGVKTIEETAQTLGGFPLVIKKVTGAIGEYVDLVNSAEEVGKFLQKMPHPSVTGKKNIILQEYIKESKGTDFRVYCVGDKILGAIKRTAKGDNFKANISLGGFAEKVELTPEMIEYSKKIMEKGNLLFAGIDFIKSDKGYLVIEINTSADFHGFEKATEINVAGEIIDAFIEKYQNSK